MGRNINDVLQEERKKKITEADIGKALGNSTETDGGLSFKPDFTYFNNNDYQGGSSYSEYNDGKYDKFENTMKRHNLKGKKVSSNTDTSGKPAGATDSYGKKGIEALKYILYKDDDPNGIQKDEDFKNMQKEYQNSKKAGSYSDGSAVVTPENEKAGATAEDSKLATAQNQKKQKAGAKALRGVQGESTKYVYSNINLV